MHLLRNKPAGRFSPVCLFRPDSIAVIGGGSEVGAQVTANLRAGGFKGGVLHADTAEDIEALPSAADLAVIATPPSPQILRALAAKGTLAAVVLCDADGLTDPEFRSGVRVLGPGSFGIAVPSIGLNASRAHLVPPAGRIGLVSQSASLCRAVVDWAGPNGVGFSHIVGIGGRADIGFGQVLDWLSRDPGTGAILIDIRQLRNRRVVPVRCPRRVAAATGGGDPGWRLGRGPERRRRPRLRGGATPGGRPVRYQPRGPVGGRRDPRPSPAGPQRGTEHRDEHHYRRADGGGRGAAKWTTARNRHRARGAGRVCAPGGAGIRGCRDTRRRRRPCGSCAKWRGRSARDRRTRRVTRRNEGAPSGLCHGRDHRLRVSALPRRSRYGRVPHARAGGPRLPAPRA